MLYADNFCECSETFENSEHLYTFTGLCVASGKQYSVAVKGPDLYKYRQGAKIQDAFPYLPASDREFLISGFSPEGWSQVFGKSK